MASSCVTSQYFTPTTVTAIAAFASPIAAFADPLTSTPSVTNSWKFPHITERMAITSLEIPRDADADSAIAYLNLKDVPQSRLDEVPHNSHSGPRMEERRSRAEVRKSPNERENAAAAEVLQIDARDFSPSPEKSRNSAPSDFLSLTSPNRDASPPPADFGSARMMDLANQQSEQQRGFLESAECDFVPPTIVLPSRYRSRRGASCSGPREIFPPKSPPLPAMPTNWANISSGAASKSNVPNRPQTADSAVARRWRGGRFAASPADRGERRGSFKQIGGNGGPESCRGSSTVRFRQICSGEELSASPYGPFTESGWDVLNADAADTSPNQADVFSATSRAGWGSLNVLPHSARSSSIGQNRAKISVQRSRSQGLFSEIPGAMFEDGPVGRAIHETGESDDGVDGGTVFTNVATNGDGMYSSYTCKSPLRNKKMAIVNQRHHKRHSIGEIDGSLFEAFSDEDEIKVHPSPPFGDNAIEATISRPQDAQQHQHQKQQHPQSQQQQGQRFSRSQSVSDNPCATRVMISSPCSPLLISAALSGAPSPRLGSRAAAAVRRSSSTMASPSSSSVAGPWSTAAPASSPAAVVPVPPPRSQHICRRSISICAAEGNSISASLSGGCGGGAGAAGGTTPPGAGNNFRSPATLPPASAVACAPRTAFCPSPRWVGKRSPAAGAFRKNGWRQQEGRQHVRCHSVSEIDGYLFEERTVAAQGMQE
ncbi:hypothetical protein CLOM_g19049 [Closterium sp. NIES-68]|nr:hypothetical protein CLOM_g19049 [Closterium sp. NIES-68]